MGAEADRRPTVKQHLEAAVAWSLFYVVRLLPVRFASAIGGWIGRTIGPRVGKHRLARRNLKMAMPELDDAAVEAILHDMWDNLGRTVFEFPHLRRFKTTGPDAEIEIVGGDVIARMRDDGKPGIFVAAHLGNWEVGPVCLIEYGLPAHMFYRAPNNPLMEPLFANRHPGSGELLPKGTRGARRALQLLSQGEHLGILIDQKMNDGIPVPFFGRDAMTAPALAQFALRFDCPVVMTRIERLEGCRFRVTLSEPMPLPRSGDHDADILALMTEVNRVLEGWIRERPAQWFWVHRRWPD
ncbi:MAG: lauroyl acyltransferase [Rhodospirillales bacterium]